MPLSDDLIRQQAQAFSATSPEALSSLSTSWLEKFKLKHNLMGARSRKGSLAPEDADDASFTASNSHTPNNASPTSQQAFSSPPAEESHVTNNQGGMKLESPDGYTNFGKGTPFRSGSTASLMSGQYTEGVSNFSPDPLSPTSPFFTPDSASPYITQTAHQALPSNADAGMHPHRQRSQTFPLLDQYMCESSNGLADPPTPKYVASTMLDSPMQSGPDPLPKLNSAVSGMHPDASRAHTVLPSDMMRPPPVPSNMAAPRSMPPGTPASNLTSATTSPEEARKAMEVVLSFFEQQPSGYLNLQESIFVGKLMEKLKLQTHES